MRASALLLAGLLLLPLAAAGDEANPDITDTQDSTSTPDQDFVAAWFTPEPSGVGFTFKVRELDAMRPNHGYAIGFDLDGARWVAMIAIKDDGTLTSSLGSRNQFAAANDPASMPGALQALSAHAGKPGYLSGRIPYSAVHGLAPGAVLQNVGASTTLFTRGQGWSEIDGTRALDGYAVQRALLPAGVVKALPYVAGGVALLAAGALGTYLLLRRRAPAALIAPTAPPTLGPEAPPGAGRMSLRPPPPR